MHGHFTVKMNDNAVANSIKEEIRIIDRKNAERNQFKYKLKENKD